MTIKELNLLFNAVGIDEDFYIIPETKDDSYDVEVFGTLANEEAAINAHINFHDGLCKVTKRTYETVETYFIPVDEIYEDGEES